MNVSSYADKVQTWNVLAMNLEPILGDLEHAREAHGKFKELVESMRALSERVEVQRSGLRDVAMQRQALVRSGRKLRNVLAAALQAHFGLESPELIKFGLKPRPDGARRIRKAKPEEPAPEVPKI